MRAEAERQIRPAALQLSCNPNPAPTTLPCREMRSPSRDWTGAAAGAGEAESHKRRNGWRVDTHGINGGELNFLNIP